MSQRQHSKRSKYCRVKRDIGMLNETTLSTCKGCKLRVKYATTCETITDVYALCVLFHSNAGLLDHWLVKLLK